MVIVSVQLVGRHVPHFLEGIEHVAVQHLGAVGLVESLDIGVLGGLARLDVIEGDALSPHVRLADSAAWSGQCHWPHTPCAGSCRAQSSGLAQLDLPLLGLEHQIR
jgi:hypothetical protein